MNLTHQRFLEYERLFTVVIAFDISGKILHTSKLVKKYIPKEFAYISDIAVFVRPNLEIQGYSKPEIEFFKANKKSQYIFLLGEESFPVRAQFMEGRTEDDTFFLLGMPWLAKLHEQNRLEDINLEEYPLFDSQIDMLVILDYQKRYLDQLMSAKDDLEAAKLKEEMANREKSNLLSMISHEMKTPLTSVFGALALLAKHINNPEEKKYIDLASSAAKNLLVQINEILSFTSYEYGDSTIVNSEFSAQEIIDETLLLYGSRTEPGSLKLEFTTNVDIENHFVADKSKIKNILVNFINNAIKHTTNNKIDVDISRVISNQKTCLKLVVRDYGAGISRDRLETIFEPFWKFELLRSSGNSGRGFGLFICKQLTEIMGGECGVYSINHDGSTFWASIPVEEVQGSQISPLIQNDRDLGVSVLNQLKMKKILLAEDNQSSRKIIAEILENLGMEVTTCINGQDAINVIANQKFDIVLLDIGMPIMDGYQAVKSIRKKLSKEELPVLAFSAFSELEDMNNLLNEGFNGYIRKPIGREELAVEITKYLSTNKLPRVSNIKKNKSDQVNDKSPVPYIDMSILTQIQRETSNSDLLGLIEMFRKELITGDSAIMKAYQSGSLERLRQEAHALKGVCLAFGAIPLAGMMKEIEIQASDPAAGVTISPKTAQTMIKKTQTALATINAAQIV